MNISKLGYELYKIDWMKRISSERQKDVIKNFYQEKLDSQTYTLEDYIFDNGYNGEIYACEEEFLNSEYLDKEYMKTLFDNNELYKEYKKDIQNTR